MDYQEQYQNYLAQAMAALEKASASATCWAAVCRRHSSLQLL